jgi:arginyl-tRNA synthetase
LQLRIAAIEADSQLAGWTRQHSDIERAVLAETAKLHAGDPENLRLWREFMPPCLAAIEAIYRRLGVRFDHTLGESFYHDRLAGVVADLQGRGVARESEGALCVFLQGSPAPMIIRKQDGAYLYATTDLATIQYRMETWRPDALLYVVDHRQGLHFEQLFAAAKLWGYGDVEFQHISFGTVLGEDGRPYKTRSGDTVGLGGLLDEAVRRAHAIVSENDDGKPGGPELSAERRQQVAESVGIAALKYADLSHNRTSDYTFSYDKMLAMNGNTATYMQYAYARVRSIFRRGQVDVEVLRRSGAQIRLGAPAEQALARQLLRFEEALAAAVADYRPNQLTNYLFELGNAYSTFFDQCPVLKAETPAARDSRLLLCDLAAQTLKQGLELLGIPVVEQM